MMALPRAVNDAGRPGGAPLSCQAGLPDAGVSPADRSRHLVGALRRGNGNYDRLW
jgi:hypothetical protein